MIIPLDQICRVPRDGKKNSTSSTLHCRSLCLHCLPVPETVAPFTTGEQDEGSAAPVAANHRQGAQLGAGMSSLQTHSKSAH